MSIQPSIQKNTYTTRHFVKGMASRGLAPLILLESTVISGRTYQANERGGFYEARERVTEETLGAVFWFSGVQGFNKLIDYFIGQKILKLPETNFDVGKDSLHNPLENYIKKTGIPKNKIAAFKFGKVASSIILANCLVGLVVPKLNQAITRYYKKKDEKRAEKRHRLNPTLEITTKTPPSVDTQLNKNKVSMSNFILKSDKTGKKDSNPTFGGMISTETLLSLANHFENDAKYQLLSTDVGIAGGRAISSRNKHERTEILFRDISSIYFYMFNMPNINRWLNQLEDGYKSRLDPVSAKYATDELKKLLKENKGTLTVEEFRKKVLDEGKYNNLLDNIKNKFEGAEKDVIKLNDFLNELKKITSPEDYAKLSNIASQMSDLQPEVGGVKLLSKNQVESIFKGGLLNNPNFLDNLFEVATRDDIPFTKIKQSNRKNPFKFVAQAELNGIKEDAINYVEDIIKRAVDGNITENILNKACRANFMKNAFNWGAGFIISSVFLSTLIPKAQYWLTKKLTGKDQFPGTTEYADDKKTDKNDKK